MSIHPIEQAAKPRLGRWGLLGGLVVGVATVIGTVAQVWPMFAPDDPAAAPATSVSTQASPPANPAPTTNAVPAPPADGRTYLSDMRAAIGAGRVVALPKALAGQTGFEHAFAIRCPSNNTGDKLVEVSYELPRGSTYASATLTGYQESSPVNQLLQLSVFPDAADRLPGGPFEGEQRVVQADPGSSATVSANVTDAFYLRLRVECRKPGATAVISDAYVRP